MAIREWHTKRTLESFRSLLDNVGELTEEDVLHCLHFEVGTRRRTSVVNRLIQQAAEINRQNYLNSLKEKLAWPVRNPQSSAPLKRRKP